MRAVSTSAETSTLQCPTPFQPGKVGSLNTSGRKDFVYVPISAGGVGVTYDVRDTTRNRITEDAVVIRALMGQAGSRLSMCRSAAPNEKFW